MHTLSIGSGVCHVNGHRCEYSIYGLGGGGCMNSLMTGEGTGRIMNMRIICNEGVW